jgi:Cu-Zn family superoxide dismutase
MHRMTYPAPQISFISYRAQSTASAVARQQTIHCCSERGEYDPAAGARVVNGPAPQPLAILLEYDSTSDGLYAKGTLGGDMYGAFFAKYELKLELDYGSGRATTRHGIEYSHRAFQLLEAASPMLIVQHRPHHRSHEVNKTLSIAAAILLLSSCAAPQQSSGPTATSTLRPASGSQVQGQVTFTQISPNRIRIAGEVSGHQPGPKGFHIHDKGDCSAPDAMSAGGHFNPLKAKHGPSPTAGHAGDMGNIMFDDSGKAVISIIVEGLSLSRDTPNGIVGRAVVVHAQPDDLQTDPTGNAGGRVACGVIS